MSDELKTQGSKKTQNSKFNTQHSTMTGTVLAFDFGTKRIGVAVGDLETGIPHPLTAISSSSNRECFTAIEKVVREWRPVLFVVGLPAHADGSEHPVARRVRRFAQRLRGRFGVHTELVNEELTSYEAQNLLRASGARRNRIKAAVDAVAAQRILQIYFEHFAGNG